MGYLLLPVLWACQIRSEISAMVPASDGCG